MLTIEVIAEVVYVLKGIYSIERGRIESCLLEFLSEVKYVRRKKEPDSEGVFQSQVLFLHFTGVMSEIRGQEYSSAFAAMGRYRSGSDGR